MILGRNYFKGCFFFPEVGWLIANCYLSSAKRMFSFHTRKVVNSFCYTPAAKTTLSFEMLLVTSEAIIPDSPPKWHEQLLPYVCSENGILRAIAYWLATK